MYVLIALLLLVYKLGLLSIDPCSPPSLAPRIFQPLFTSASRAFASAFTNLQSPLVSRWNLAQHGIAEGPLGRFVNAFFCSTYSATSVPPPVCTSLNSYFSTIAHRFLYRLRFQCLTFTTPTSYSEPGRALLSALAALVVAHHFLADNRSDSAALLLSLPPASTPRALFFSRLSLSSQA